MLLKSLVFGVGNCTAQQITARNDSATYRLGSIMSAISFSLTWAEKHARQQMNDKAQFTP